MKKTLAVLALIALSTPASAGCFGSGTLYTCSDDYGNNYTINKLGNSTYMNGYNFKTGNSWSQNSQRFGNTTITNGFDSQGRMWNQTTNQFGRNTSTGFCGIYGCQ